MSDSNRTAQPFAYILIVEANDAARDHIQKTVRAPNCVLEFNRQANRGLELKQLEEIFTARMPSHFRSPR